jgi:hypothetical protein
MTPDALIVCPGVASSFSSTYMESYLRILLRL